MTLQELAERIRDVALLKGDFLLRSGRRSSYYIDKYLFETQPEILSELGRRLAGKVTERTTLIAGAELGGVALAAAAAMVAGLPFVIVRSARKGYGTQRRLEGACKPGDRLLLVEDVVTSGGQVIESAKVLRETGASIENVVAVIDRGEGGADNIRDAGYPFESLLDAGDLGLSRE